MRKIDHSLFDYDVKDYGSLYHRDEVPLASCAHPFGLFHDKPSEKAVLLIHGFTGYTGELIRPGMDLYEAGFDVMALRLPGHGSSANDFMQTNDAMWLGAATDGYNELCKKYKSVYIVGHSMGGTIATIIAERCHVERMVLIAPAIVLKRPMGLAKILRPFVAQIKTKWASDLDYKPYYKNAPCDDAYLGSQYWKYIYPKEVSHLQHLTRVARKGLNKLSSDILILFGDNDATVDVKSADIIGKSNQGETVSVVIPNGTHLLPYDKDYDAQDEAISECVKFLSKA